MKPMDSESMGEGYEKTSDLFDDTPDPVDDDMEHLLFLQRISASDASIWHLCGMDGAE
jgi:hypothetical protein